MYNLLLLLNEYQSQLLYAAANENLKVLTSLKNNGKPKIITGHVNTQNKEDNCKYLPLIPVT